ncbi:hypothetical protein RclHR1_15140003 [Rhizophagus clarus]|uniref:Uncharacterized protein n=1 Tax=Rhizophagus clarus TaxID=94130 RepID=A0A2Z6QIQ7_9GLOM|nr:hypothetical protein RclHR1_15140003 [Rhizophagus clarus]
MAIFPNENISSFSVIIFVIWNLNFYISSFIYLILIPANSISIKIIYSLLLIAGIHSIYLVSELNSEVKGLVRIILFALPNDELKLEIKINKIIAHEIKPSLESLSELLKLQGSKPKQMAIFKYTLEKIEPELNLLSELLELQGENRLNKDIEKQMRKLEEIVEKIKEGQVESILQRFKPLDTIIKRWKNISTNSEERYVVTVEALEKR